MSATPPSPWGSPPSAPGEAPAPSPVGSGPTGTPKGLVVAGVLVAGVTVVLGALLVVLGSGRDGSPPVVAPATDDRPLRDDEGWDPRIEALADFVAEARGRPFLEPVEVRFLDDEAYEDAALEGAELTDDDLEDLDVLSSQLQALALVADDVDLAEQLDAIYSRGTLGFYDPESDVITIRGSDLDVAGRVSVVHELTHAWQDQHFDLDRVDDLDPGQATTLGWLAEGDAGLVEDDYVAGLSDAEREEYVDTSRAQSEQGTAALAEVDDVLRASFSSSYALGPSFAGVLLSTGGLAELDAAFEDPPVTEAQVLEPGRWFDGGGPAEVDTPVVPDDAEVLDEAPFGALSWLFTLGARIDPRAALDVLDGWAGDSSVTYLVDEGVCVAVTVRGVDPEATGAWSDALEDWVGADPPGTGTVARDGDDVVLRSCSDPGSSPSGDGRAQLALDYAALRLSLIDQLLGGPVGPDGVDDAHCVADHFVDSLSAAELRQPLSPDEQQRRGAEAAEACQAGPEGAEPGLRPVVTTAQAPSAVTASSRT